MSTFSENNVATFISGGIIPFGADLANPSLDLDKKVFTVIPIALGSGSDWKNDKNKITRFKLLDANVTLFSPFNSTQQVLSEPEEGKYYLPDFDTMLEVAIKAKDCIASEFQTWDDVRINQKEIYQILSNNPTNILLPLSGTQDKSKIEARGNEYVIAVDTAEFKAGDLLNWIEMENYPYILCYLCVAIDLRNIVKEYNLAEEEAGSTFINIMGKRYHYNETLRFQNEQRILRGQHQSNIVRVPITATLEYDGSKAVLEPFKGLQMQWSKMLNYSVKIKAQFETGTVRKTDIPVSQFDPIQPQDGESKDDGGKGSTGNKRRRRDL